MKRENMLKEPFPLNRIEEYRKTIDKNFLGFKLIHLELLEHPFLGSFQMEFIETDEINNGPYTSLIIGPNGSGKSYLQRVIIDLFRQLEYYEEKVKTPSLVAGGFNLIFVNKGEFYTYGNIEYVEEKNGLAIPVRKILEFDQLFKVHENEKSNLKNSLPTKVIASSSMLWDKFPNPKKTELISNRYNYLGIRNTARSAGTKSLIKKTIEKIVQNINGKGLLPNLKILFEFLEYDPSVIISYVPKYRNIFWGKGLDYKSFCQLFDNWKETFNDRETEHWGYKYYIKIKGNRVLIESICSFLNSAPLESYGKSNRGKYFSFDVLNDSRIAAVFPLLVHLDKLDLLFAPELNLFKNGSEMTMESVSSGEVQIITSLISIAATIDHNSIVLIDEPEVSLHPNWQMKYMFILNKMFEKFPTCHFIIASHSHFMVSDSKDEISKVIGVSRIKSESDKIKSTLCIIDAPQNAYGWSADEILYKVFDVRTTRNHFIEMDLRKISELIAKNSKDLQKIDQILSRLKKVVLDEYDPMNKIIEEIETYLKENDSSTNV
jgi:hypothetical protein